MKERVIKSTLCLPIRGSRLLLARKTRGVCKGRLIPYGGQVKPEEEVKVAAIRELFEESGLIATNGSTLKVAHIDFHNQSRCGEAFIYECHVFLVGNWAGSLMPTEEMVEPAWFEISRLPFEEMMPADRYWLPLVLSRMKIYAEFWYGQKQKSLLWPPEIRDVGIGTP